MVGWSMTHMAAMAAAGNAGTLMVPCFVDDAMLIARSFLDDHFEVFFCFLALEVLFSALVRYRYQCGRMAIG
jgi:hypothetical protein